MPGRQSYITCLGLLDHAVHTHHKICDACWLPRCCGATYAAGFNLICLQALLHIARFRPLTHGLYILCRVCRPLPETLPWTMSATQQQQGDLPVQHASLQLQEIDRAAAAAWQNSTVAVVDTGHHSCLAAAIRLSAVYRLPSVVLLQLEQ
jgi:hypothetical protein